MLKATNGDEYKSEMTDIDIVRILLQTDNWELVHEDDEELMQKGGDAMQPEAIPIPPYYGEQ